WMVVFRSADPRLWNRNWKDRNNLAVELKKVPDDIKYLKLTNTRSRDYVIVAVTKDKLTHVSDDGQYGWNGENKFEYNAYHLGVFDRTAPVKQIGIHIRGAFQGWPGWGFGNRARRDDRQGYAWADVEIAPTVFEIAVTAGPLTTAETKQWLRKK